MDPHAKKLKHRSHSASWDTNNPHSTAHSVLTQEPLTNRSEKVPLTGSLSSSGLDNSEQDHKITPQLWAFKLGSLFFTHLLACI